MNRDVAIARARDLQSELSSYYHPAYSRTAMSRNLDSYLTNKLWDFNDCYGMFPFGMRQFFFGDP